MTERSFYLQKSRLEVNLQRTEDTEYLAVVSRVDPEQSFLLPLRPQPICGGLSLFTKLGRLHALYWGLAYGAGPVDAGTVVRFEPAPFRRQPAVEVVPESLAGGRWWVADADGIFARVLLLATFGLVAEAELAESW